MAFEQGALKFIFKRTDGRCHICRKKLCFTNYGLHGARGAWQVEHSKPRAKGGTDHRNNLYAACITCNLDKGTQCSRTARSRNGYSSAPLSKVKKDEIRGRNTVSGGVLGFFTGLAVAGTGGAGLVFAAIGAVIGGSISPEG